MSSIQVYNPDLPDGPGNRKPKSQKDKVATLLETWRQEAQDREGQRPDWEDEKEPKIKGRPRTVINWDVFDNLCETFCTLQEIAGWFKCSEDTIQRAVKRQHGTTFEKYFNIASAPGKVSVKRAQFRAAVGGNVLAQIWIGKQYLGQRDQPQAATEDDEKKKAQEAIQDAYGITFFGKPGDENTRQNPQPSPEAVRPYNVPGPDATQQAAQASE